MRGGYISPHWTEAGRIETASILCPRGREQRGLPSRMQNYSVEKQHLLLQVSVNHVIKSSVGRCCHRAIYQSTTLRPCTCSSSPAALCAEFILCVPVSGPIIHPAWRFFFMFREDKISCAIIHANRPRYSIIRGRTKSFLLFFQHSRISDTRACLSLS